MTARTDDEAVRDERLEAERLERAAAAGRVAHSGFLDPAASARLARALADRGVSCDVWGGFPGARRRTVTAHPAHVPHARAALAGLYFAAARDEREVADAIRAAGVPAGDVGDLVVHQEGVSLVTFDPPDGRLLELPSAFGALEAAPVPPERVGTGSVRTLATVVPSLRVDVVGAKAFRVSRSYFAKGIAGGKVSVNGKLAGKSSSAEPGDEIYAEGLGRLRVLHVDGETRRGNLKLRLEVEVG